MWACLIRVSLSYWVAPLIKKESLPCVCYTVWYVCVCVPVEPAQQTLGGSDQLHHCGQKLIGGLMGDLAVVDGVLPALRHCAIQVVMSCSHLPHQSLQVIWLHAVILQNIQKDYFKSNKCRAINQKIIQRQFKLSSVNKMSATRIKFSEISQFFIESFTL